MKIGVVAGGIFVVSVTVLLALAGLDRLLEPLVASVGAGAGAGAVAAALGLTLALVPSLHAPSSSASVTAPRVPNVDFRP
jgi:hypothetical protein